jgi:broad specificity phosphatase PhoE
VDVSYWDDLKEYDVGIVSGMTWDEITVRYPHIDRELQTSRQLAGVEGAESLADRRARGQRVVDALLGGHAQGDVVVIVTHGGILQQVLAALMGTDRTWGVSVHNTAVYDFDIDLERWGINGEGLFNTAFWRIIRFNDASHLD